MKIMNKVKWGGVLLLLMASLTLFSQRQRLGTSDTYYEITGSSYNRTLTISGYGDMPNLGTFVGFPWYNIRENIKTLIMGDSITSISAWAFYQCAIEDTVQLPDSLVSIGLSAFCNTRASHFIFPNTLISIGQSAFRNCSQLASVTIPSSVTTLGLSAFTSCPLLESVTVESGSQHFSSWDGVLYNLDTTTLLYYPIGKPDSSFIIPNSVTSFASDLFYNSRLYSVTIPEGVTILEDNFFYGCSTLQHFTIPSSIIRIDPNVFGRCNNIKEVVVMSQTPPMLFSGFLASISTPPLVYIPCGSLATYQTATNWQNIQTFIEAVDTNGMIFLRANDTEMGSVSFVQTPCDSQVVIQAVPNPGHLFCYWMDGSSDNIRAINVTQDTIFTAFFRSIGTDASLSNLSVSEGVLTPAFHPDSLNYFIEANWIVSSINILATVSDTNASLLGDIEQQFLEVGSNVFTISVMAEDSVTERVYTITVTRLPNTDATLSNLTVSDGALSPLFNPEVFHYEVSVPQTTATLSIVGIPTDINATLTGNVTNAPLDLGNYNVFHITVRAQDRVTTQTYTVNVTRESGIGIETIDLVRLSASPNPTTGKLQIKSGKIINTIQLYDLSGKVLQSWSSIGTHETTIDLSNFANGNYLLRVDENTMKIVKN